MRPGIMSIGRAVPPGTLDQDEALQLAEQCCAGSAEEADRLRRLFERSGVETRQFVVARTRQQQGVGRVRDRNGTSSTDVIEPIVPFFPPRLHDDDLGPTTAERLAVYEQWASGLAHRAAWEALSNAKCAASQITHLMTVSCTGMRAPGVDIALIESLGLARDVRRAHVGFMGCHAAINALRLASDACRADPDAIVLVVCVELCSVHFQYRGDGECLLANALFADGAGAAIVSGRDDPRSAAPIGLLDFASVVLPDSQECMTWSVGDHGFEMNLALDVPARIRAAARPWIEEWLGRHGMSIGHVGSWAVHPGGPRILDAFAGALELDCHALEASRQVLAQFGNMSSPTILFILDELVRSGARRPMVAIAFGPGLTIEAALLG